MVFVQNVLRRRRRSGNDEDDDGGWNFIILIFFLLCVMCVCMCDRIMMCLVFVLIGK